MRGRKPKWESRAVEFYGTLARWKQAPESARPSLRALARELGTSQQLLSHYLERLETWQAEWQAKEYRRQAKDIRARAEAEHRSLTPWEAQRAEAYDQEAFQWMIESMLISTLKQLERDTKAGSLHTEQVKMLRFMASRRYRNAHEILAKYTLERAMKGNSSAAREIRKAIEG